MAGIGFEVGLDPFGHSNLMSGLSGLCPVSAPRHSMYPAQWYQPFGESSFSPSLQDLLMPKCGPHCLKPGSGNPAARQSAIISVVPVPAFSIHHGFGNHGTGNFKLNRCLGARGARPDPPVNIIGRLAEKYRTIIGRLLSARYIINPATLAFLYQLTEFTQTV